VWSDLHHATHGGALNRQNSYRAFSLYEVQLYGKQLLSAVSFLHKMHLIHTDLKLENILLENSDWEYHRSRKHGRSRVVKKKEVVVIDLGSATYEHEHHASVVSTRHYRAPEVVLGDRLLALLQLFEGLSYEQVAC
jgi:serine/threonine protein kinase